MLFDDAKVDFAVDVDDGEMTKGKGVEEKEKMQGWRQPHHS